MCVCVYHNFFFFFFFFFGFACDMWKSLGQELNPSHSCDLCHSCHNTGSLPHCTTVGTPCIIFIHSSVDADTMASKSPFKRLSLWWFVQTAVENEYGTTVVENPSSRPLFSDVQNPLPGTLKSYVVVSLSPCPSPASGSPE